MAVGAFGRGQHREGNEPRAGEGEGICARVHASDVQASRTQRLELRRIRLHREESDLLARHFGHVLDEAVPDVLVYGRILDRGIGEDDSVGIDPLALVNRQVRGEVAVTVAVALVEERSEEHPSELTSLMHSQYAVY